MKKIIGVLLLLFFSGFAKAQHGDCNSMLPIKESIYHSEPISGYGDKKEFEGNDLENKKIFEEEKNSIWYLISMPADGAFTFDIETQNQLDDWDFLLFEYKKMFCKRIDAKKVEPIRSNLSRSPITGLVRGSKESFVGAGLNENYSKPVFVKKGTQYVLVVNNAKRSGGVHTLKLHFPGKEKTVVKIEKKIEKKEVEPTETISFSLSIKDASTKELLPSDVSISGLRKKDIYLDTITGYETRISKQNHNVNVIAHAKNYMLTSKSFKIPANELMYSVEILLEKIQKGKKVNLDNIQFYGNRFDFLPSAKNSLKSLLSFMEQNQQVAIQIDGHVNGPDKKNTKDYQELSYNRAYAVKNYLVKKGIAPERIDFKGYGNSKMLYPDPKSSFQESANRRVEIKILSNEYNSGVGDIH